MPASSPKNVYAGIGLALLAVIIWSGNFIVARGVIHQIPPVSLAFYRWLLASLIILPIAFRSFKREWPLVKRSWFYLFWVSLTGIALFNTFVYIGAHYTTAINLALIGTTSSPIFAILLARIFLGEKIGIYKLSGLILCIAGVLFLISKGDMANLVNFHFTVGDGWVLLAGLSFAIYNTLVKKKPAGITPVNFLFTIFSFGTILLMPFFINEQSGSARMEWTASLLFVILYLGLGASVICFLFWNKAITCLGAGRTALFGNLIPVFSSVEAAFILGEKFTTIHVVSMLLVFSGIVIANLVSSRR